MKYGPYDWPEPSSPLSRELIACLPITHMSQQQLQAFKEALEKVHELENAVQDLARQNCEYGLEKVRAKYGLSVGTQVLLANSLRLAQ